MIYSKTTEYAIRALAYMATQPKGSAVNAREVSRETSVPFAYISKTLLALARAGLLESRRGPGGGFTLGKAPSKIHLMDVMKALEDPGQPPFSQCVMGLKFCDSKNPCPLHPIWAAASRKITRQLEKSSLLDMAGLIGKFSTGAPKRQRVLSRGMRNVFGHFDRKGGRSK